jgi:3-dehydroquinate dehydratase-1
MQKLNPEYVKIAVMPKEKQDVAMLLEAVAYTLQFLHTQDLIFAFYNM